MKIKITGIIIMAAFAGTLIFSMCSKNQPKTDHQIYIGVACYDQKDTFIGELLDSFKEECSSMEKQGYAISMTIMDAAKSQRVQNDQIKQMINDGCNVLCVNLADRTEPSEIIDAAREKDIPIIFFNREPVYEDIMQWDKLYYVGGDAAQSGTLQGETAAEIICEDYAADRNSDGKIQYVLLEGEAGHQDAIMRTDSVVSTIQKEGIILEKLSYQFANWNRGQAENKMTQLINRYGVEIELVISNNDEMALGAAAAYDALGYPQDSRPVILGIDGLDSALEAVKKGYIQGTVYNDKEGQAGRISDLAMDLFQGKALADYDFENGRYIFLPYHKVTADNVDEFLK